MTLTHPHQKVRKFQTGNPSSIGLLSVFIRIFQLWILRIEFRFSVDWGLAELVRGARGVPLD